MPDEIGYNKASIHTDERNKSYIRKGTVALMNPSNDRIRGDLKETITVLKSTLASTSISIKRQGVFGEDAGN